MSKKIVLRVERTIVEQAVVEFQYDHNEYEEWLDGNPGATDEDVIEFLMSDRDYPESMTREIPENADWSEQTREFELMVEARR